MIKSSHFWAALLLLLLSATACVKTPGQVATPPVAPPAAPSAATAASTPVPADATPEDAPAPVATEPPDESPLVEFSLPKFKVRGKIVVKGVDPKTNIMETPNNKDDVAYYDFTPHPGLGCQTAGQCANTVLSAHVDWFTGQVGVFWHLKDLSEGDEVHLKLEDGKLYTYKVAVNTIYKADEAPVAQILGDTPEESVTLITCDGVFNKSLHEYNARRVVRAVRSSDS